MRKKKIMLIIFCVFFGTASICIVYITISKRFSTGDFSINRIIIPYHIGKNFQPPFGMIDSRTYNRVEHFKIYLDSLKIDNASRFEAIISNRPHLIDSILAFEKIYQLQLKK